MSTFLRTAIVGFWPVVFIPIRNTAELAMSTQSLGTPKGRMSVGWHTWFSTGNGVQIPDWAVHICAITRCAVIPIIWFQSLAVVFGRLHC